MTSAQAARYLRLLGVSVRRPDLGTYLGGIERHGFGGTCYANNHYFLFVARFCPNGGVIIRNFHRSVVQDGSTEAHDLPSRDDVIRAITADFGMPGEIVRPIVIDLLASDHH